MRPIAKAGVVAAGYLAAFVIASVGVALYVAATAGPDRDSSAGMYAFGDTLLFLALFVAAALPATAAALFLLRPVRTFWVVFSAVALLLSSTAMAASIVYLTQQPATAGPAQSLWPALAVLRILLEPLLAPVLLLAAALAPSRGSRRALVLCGVVESASFAAIALLWLRQPS